MSRRSFAMLAIVLFLAPSGALADSVVTRCAADDEPSAEIDLGKAVAAGGRVTFACPAGAVIRITRRHAVGRDTRIDGAGTITLDAGGATAIFDVSDPGIVLGLAGLRILRARPSGAAKGGVVSGRATVEVARTAIVDSRSAFNLVEGTVRLADSEVAGGQDAVIIAPNIELTRTRIHGPALHAAQSSGGTVVIRNSDIAAGGSSLFDGCRLEIWDSRISSSLATAIVSGCDTFISNSRFLSNSGERGGALYLRKAAPALAIRGGAFIGNSATVAGGAIAIEPTEQDPRPVLLRDVRFESNRAPDGGAIHLGAFIENNVLLQGRALLFASNSAVKTGGAIAGANVRLQLSRTVFAGNSAGVRGGAIDLMQFGVRPSVIANSIFTRNKAPAGSAFRGAAIQFLSTTFASNEGGPALAPFRPTPVINAPEPWQTVRLKNSLLTANAPAGCDTGPFARLFADGGNNLQFPAAGCPASIPVADPKLDSMFVPFWGGPADATGDLAACLAAPVSGIDVYGRHRPQGKSCSIGAVEGSVEDAVLRRHPRFGSLPKNPPQQPGCPCPSPSAGGAAGKSPVRKERIEIVPEPAAR